MVTQANKKRLDKEFNISDWVYLKLQNYRQKPVQERKNHKLSRRFFGPYKILDRIGKVAYKLDLPATSRIHPNFHVSLLKASHGTAKPSQIPIDSGQLEDPVEMLQEAILDHRLGNTNQPQLLIKWEKRPLEDATWEDTSLIKDQFLFFPVIEDNASSPGEGDDTTRAGPIADPAAPRPSAVNRPKRNV
ncbi:putative chromatin remodeling & transcriptional activation CHROMO-DOMAIN family [Helianthus annuus]|nr:putative chromatin remodeling & transcriptional activation CHROMO-DOMAIN family [Helianthus annuus]